MVSLWLCSVCLDRARDHLMGFHSSWCFSVGAVIGYGLRVQLWAFEMRSASCAD